MRVLGISIWWCVTCPLSLYYLRMSIPSLTISLYFLVPVDVWFAGLLPVSVCQTLRI